MQKVNSSWGRMILALVIVLCIAGPGLVLAANGPGYSIPEYAVIEGTFTAVGTSTASLFVEFTDGSSGTLTTQPTYTATHGGSFSGNVYSPPAGAVAGTTKDLLKAVYTSAGSSVTASRVVVLQ